MGKVIRKCIVSRSIPEWLQRYPNGHPIGDTGAWWDDSGVLVLEAPPAWADYLTGKSQTPPWLTDEDAATEEPFSCVQLLEN